MSVLKRVAPHTPLETIVEILDRDGCIVLANLLGPAELKALRSELAPHFEATSDCRGDFYGHHTKRISGLITKSSSCASMAIHPLVLAIMDSFLLKGCSAYQLNLTQGIRIGPGEPKQVIHPDDLMYPFDHPAYECMINCMWAVDDFTAANGATQVVPGSHKWEFGQEPMADQVIQAEMPAGSLLIYFASLLHGGGANHTTEPRTGVVLSYSLGWLRQAENHYLACPPALASQLPKRLQELLGYFVHPPNLGCLEGQDPMACLEGNLQKNGQFEEFLPPEAKDLLDKHRAELEKSTRSLEASS